MKLTAKSIISKYKFIMLLYFMISTLLTIGQDVSFKPENFPNKEEELLTIVKNLKAATILYENGNNYCEYNLEPLYCKQAQSFYQEALPLFLEAHAFNENNADLNFKIATSYLSGNNKYKALPYFEKIESLNTIPHEDFNLLYAQSLHLNGNWQKL
ncbi:MAG: hypothetical protein IPO21_12675 [Bacteroidales bacterium]|nr:hypothetical protein [Bacteroidales bacterium]